MYSGIPSGLSLPFATAIVIVITLGPDCMFVELPEIICTNPINNYRSSLLSSFGVKYMKNDVGSGRIAKKIPPWRSGRQLSSCTSLPLLDV